MYCQNGSIKFIFFGCQALLFLIEKYGRRELWDKVEICLNLLCSKSPDPFLINVLTLYKAIGTNQVR